METNSLEIKPSQAGDVVVTVGPFFLSSFVDFFHDKCKWTLYSWLSVLMCLQVLWQYNLVQTLQDKDIQVTVTKQTISEEIYDVRSCVR